MLKNFFLKIFSLLILSILTVTASVTPVLPTNPSTLIPSPPNVGARSYILIDASSGAVLAEKNSDQRVAPASLTKLMSLYITFKALANNQIKLTDNVPISEAAWKTGGSRMFVKVGTQVPLEDLLRGTIIASGNDATMALSEYIGGTSDAFVQLMNQEAKNLGMANTHYTDPTGLPDKDHFSSARDFAILSQAIIQTFPQYYHYFSEKWFTYNNIRQPNRNRLLWSNLNVDGLKTGHTDDAGYCLIGSAKQNDTRLIAIVMGTASEQARAGATQALLQYGFRFFKTQKLYDAYQKITEARVYGGAEKQIAIGLTHDLAVTLPANLNKSIVPDIQLNTPLKAPILKGQVLGTITLSLDGKTVLTESLLALEDDPSGSAWRRFVDWWAFLFHKIF